MRPLPTEGTEKPLPLDTLLSSDEPAAFALQNPKAVASVLLVCDHASRRFPSSLGTMGLDLAARRCHLAWDIGAGELTRRLAESLGITAVLCEYSRLVVDCNRQLNDPGAFLEFGDGIVIPGNSNLQKDDKALRANEIYWSYHNAITHEIERLAKHGIKPVFVSVHSFTPVMKTKLRPWEIGVLWDRDRLTAEMFIQDFRDEGFVVGDNEPYSGKAPEDFSIDNHAESQGLRHVGIEIRQDLLHHETGVARLAAIMHKIIASLPERISATNIADSA